MKTRIGASLLLDVSAASAALIVLLLIAPGRACADRLPTTVRPEHYTLTLTPDLKTATYSGAEAIDVVLTGPGASITLNASKIAFKSVRIVSQAGEQAATVALD